MKSKLLLALGVALGLSFGVTAAQADQFKLKAPPKIAMIMFAAKNDGGWTQAHNEARERMEKALDTKIAYVENVAEDSAQITPAVEKFIQRGYNIIIGTAFGYSDTFKELAAKHPDVAFLNAAGTTNGPNLESFYGRTYQGHYLCGMAAGFMTKTGKLGFVGANPFGLVNWTVNAYELGAKLANPKVTTTAVFIGTWLDPVKERAAATALIDQGADVIGEHVDTPTVTIVAQERGVYATGHHRDMTEFAPKATICSSVWVWDRFLVPEIKKIEAGTWTPAPYGAFPSIAEGGIDIKLGPSLPKQFAEKVMAEREALIKGKQIFAGPIVDTTGKERVPAGKVLSDADLWKMDWYVPGVITQK
jgi:basic membrane lipoprotein Med (substrate-binding protein (PBP1-ABC) superfamily)